MQYLLSPVTAMETSSLSFASEFVIAVGDSAWATSSTDQIQAYRYGADLCN